MTIPYTGVFEAPPADATFGTLSGNVSSFLASAGAASGAPLERECLSGTVRFTPLAPQNVVVDTATGDLIYCGPETVHIQKDGTIHVVLLANDNPNIQPFGWMYQVTVSPIGYNPVSFPAAIVGGATQTLGQAYLNAATVSPIRNAGSLIQTGTGAPSSATSGTFYIDAATGNLWQKTGS